MAALLRRRRHVEENQRNYPIQRQRRVFRDRQNPLELFTPVQIWARYRFRPATIVGLAQALSAELEHPTDNNHALPPLLQVCLALRYLSSGNFAIVVGDTCPVVSPPTAWRAIDRTVRAINRVLGIRIKFPDPQDQISTQALQQGFFKIAGKIIIGGFLELLLIGKMRV